MPAASQSPKRTRICLRYAELRESFLGTGRLGILKCVENSASNDQLLDFGCAFVDSQWPDLAIQVLDDRADDNAKRTEDLNSGIDYTLRGFCGRPFGHGRFNGK